MNHKDSSLNKNYPISSAANVYSIGLIMWYLMQLQADGRVELGPYKHLQLSPGAREYSPEPLVKAVESYLEPLPRDRIGARDLFAFVKKFVDRGVPVKEGSDETVPFKKQKLPVKSYVYPRFARE